MYGGSLDSDGRQRPLVLPMPELTRCLRNLGLRKEKDAGERKSTFEGNWVGVGEMV
jgi:hypothetical protein